MTTNEHTAIDNRTIGTYLDALASSQPAPGGGSVAGLVGALAAGLGEMVVSLTRDADPELVKAADTLSDLRASALASGAADEQAYGGYVEASKMPKETDQQKSVRKATMQEALEEAAAVPLELALTAGRVLDALAPIVRHGSTHVLSDAAIAITLALACVDASLINVRINLPMIRNDEVVTSIRGKAQEAEQRARRLAEELRDELANR